VVVDLDLDPGFSMVRIISSGVLEVVMAEPGSTLLVPGL